MLRAQNTSSENTPERMHIKECVFREDVLEKCILKNTYQRMHIMEYVFRECFLENVFSENAYQRLRLQRICVSSMCIKECVSSVYVFK